jgi:CHAT domain-containing protein/Flp pilus assembly protein TadD
MRTLLLAICLLFCTNLFAQTFAELKATFEEQYKDEEYEDAAKTVEKLIPQAKIEFGEKHTNFALALFYGGEVNYKLQSFKKAISYYNKAISVLIKLYNTEAIDDVALMRNSIGTIHYANSKYDSAIYYYRKAADHYFISPSAEYQTVYTVGKNLIAAYSNINDHEKVVAVADKLQPIVLAQSSVNNEHYYDVVTTKAQSLLLLNRYSQAEVAYREALYVCEKLVGKETGEYGALHLIIFRIKRLQLKNEEAEEHLRIAAEYTLRSKPIDTSILISIFSEGGTFYTETAEFSKADSCFDLGLEWCKKGNLLTTDTYFNLLYQKGSYLVQASANEAAKEIFETAIAAMQKSGSKNEMLFGQIYSALSNAEVQLGHLTNAEKLAKDAIKILQKLQPEGSMEESMAYQALGAIYSKLSRSEESIAAFEKAIKVSQEVLGEDNKLEAIIYANLGNTYLEMGDYAKAETVYIRAVTINFKLYGGNHPYYAISVANLGLLYIHQGRYVDADKFLAEVITIYSRNNMMDTDNARLVVSNLAYMYLMLGDYNQARELYSSVLENMDVNGKRNAEVLFYIYHNMTTIYEAEKKYDSVIIYENMAIKLLKETNKTRTDKYIKAGNMLLRAYLFTNQLDQATTIGNEMITLTKEVMGDRSQVLAMIYSNMSWLEKKKGNADKAADYINQSGTIQLENFKKNFYILSEKEKLSWWTKESYQFDIFPIILNTFKIDSGKYAAALMDQRLQIKGFVLHDAAAGLKRAREKGSAEVKALIDEWEATKALLAKLYSLPVDDRQYDIDSLENELNFLEKRISKEGSVDIEVDNNVSWKDIKAKLKDDEAAIEFFAFKYYDADEFKDSTLYAAMLIRNSYNSPKIVYLSGEKKIANLLAIDSKGSKQTAISRLYRASIKGVSNNNNFLGDSLYNNIWKPLMPYLNGVKKISFAPDGILHKIAFQALPVENGSLLIDNFQLQQYSSVKQLLDTKETQPQKWTSALLLGNPDFNNTTFKGKPITFTGKGDWQPLSGTAQEIAAIQNLLTSKGVAVKNFNGQVANEENFKKMRTGYPDILHLATHGFFLKDSTQNSIALAAMGASSNVVMNPLLRSGLILAGANKAWGGEKLPPGAEDGILNAYEISQLNLTKTKLVVLSACETALGEVQTNEGVFGLQRAFKMAGAKNLIVSLWQVPDKETAELMSTFYSYLFKNYSVRDAFYQAQTEMRKKYAPFSWAAFVLIE